MRIMVEQVEKEEVKIKEGDLIIYNDDDIYADVYMVIRSNDKYSWVRLNTGFVKNKYYETIESMVNCEFLNGSFKVYDSEEYHLRLSKI